MAEAAPEHSRRHEIDSRLHTLGVAESLLRDAVSRGLSGRRSCTAFHPPNFPGIVQWAETHRALREFLVPTGWQPDDSGGFSTVIRPDGEVAIAVMTGSDRTGKSGLPHPVTKYTRGPLTHAAIEVNQLAMLLFGARAGQTVDEQETRARRVTWILLVSTRHDEVRMELSCPLAIDESGRISAWSERIILPSLDLESTLEFVDDDDPDEPEIEVSVEPR